MVGPTAAGKSAVGLRLAQELSGEIVGADSRQVYRYMDIGTAKPSMADMATVKHHVVDIIEPSVPFSLSGYQQLAQQALLEIDGRGELPLLVGGSGQYVWGLIDGWEVPEIPPDEEFRRVLEARAEKEGHEPLYAELEVLAPDAAARIDPLNVRRVVRALEVARAAPGAKARKPSKTPIDRDVLVVGITMERGALYQRIDDRVDEMISAGWVDEVQRLIGLGYGPELPSMSSFGYGELVEYIRGETTLDDAVQRIKFKTHRFARNQYAWFKPSDERIMWFDASSGLDEISVAVRRWLESRSG